MWRWGERTPSLWLQFCSTRALPLYEDLVSVGCDSCNPSSLLETFSHSTVLYKATLFLGSQKTNIYHSLPCMFLGGCYGKLATCHFLHALVWSEAFGRLRPEVTCLKEVKAEVLNMRTGPDLRRQKVCSPADLCRCRWQPNRSLPSLRSHQT